MEETVVIFIKSSEKNKNVESNKIISRSSARGLVIRTILCKGKNPLAVSGESIVLDKCPRPALVFGEAKYAELAKCWLFTQYLSTLGCLAEPSQLSQSRLSAR